MPAVRRSDGIEVTLASGATVVADATVPDGDVAVTTHAHGDHLFAEPPPGVVCSPTTAALARVRRPDVAEAWTRTTDPRIALVDAGHVPGSRAALIEGPETTYCYTGDIAVRDRFGLTGFEPPPADVLVVEATYGRPAYRFPPQAELEGRIVDWLDDTLGQPLVLFGYTLGRAQELIALAARSDRQTTYVTDAVARVTEALPAAHVTGEPERYGEDVTLGDADVLVAPSQLAGTAFAESVVDETGALTAGFSGWAVDEAYRYRLGVDRAFPLSDHCDYDELLGVVRATAPDRVYTTHGFADELATRIVAETGTAATALKRDQATLGEF